MSSSPSRDLREDVLDNAVKDLERAAKTPAKQRVVKITKQIEKVTSKAYEDGVSGKCLEKLVDIITLPNELDQASTGAIIRNLYPAEKVASDVVVKVVCSLGHGVAKPAFSTQAALLKWLIMVYDVLENQRILSQLYSYLFNLLDTIAIRPPLCHLLSLITRRKHVRPYRIQILLDLGRQSAHEPPVVGLLRVYKDYYPDVIVGDSTVGRASVFLHPNPEWRERLEEIQEAFVQQSQQKQTNTSHTFKVARRGINGVKRRKISVVPEVRTSRAHESSVTLEEIESVQDFVQKLDKIELPNQLVAVIGDPLLQNLLSLKSSQTNLRRVDNWLEAFFEDQASSDEGSQGRVLDMLGAIRDFVTYSKTIPPACLRYLQSMLISWDGVTGREIILDLLTYLPFAPFEDHFKSTLQSLEDAILDDTPESQAALLSFYTSLLRQWTTTLLSNKKASLTASTTTSALTVHANLLALTLLNNIEDKKPHPLAAPTILSFYEATAFLISHPDLRHHTRITTPPAQLIYTLHFTQSLHVLSRLCGILALYKRAFETAMASKVTAGEVSPTAAYPKDYVNHFNGFLMDICNCLWRSRAFNTTDTNALGCLLPPHLVHTFTAYLASLSPALSLSTTFSLSFSPVLCNLSISYMRELEDIAVANANNGECKEVEIRHAGPVTLKSLVQLGKDSGLVLSWPDYRLGVLRYLEAKGVDGVGELMYNTLKQLMNAREAALKAAAT